MTLHSCLSHHYSHGSSSLQFSISSTDGLLDEETIRTAYSMVCSILVNATVAHATIQQQITQTVLHLVFHSCLTLTHQRQPRSRLSVGWPTSSTVTTNHQLLGRIGEALVGIKYSVCILLRQR